MSGVSLPSTEGRLMRIEWGGRHEFAEAAEALQITTELVVGMVPHEDGVIALFTPDVNGSVWSAFLFRDSFGILVVHHKSDTGKTLLQMIEDRITKEGEDG